MDFMLRLVMRIRRLRTCIESRYPERRAIALHWMPQEEKAQPVAGTDGIVPQGQPRVSYGERRR
jgi:hypothetical protein